MADTEQHYWEEVPDQNRVVYEGFVHKIKYSIAIGAIVVAFLLFLAY